MERRYIIEIGQNTDKSYEDAGVKTLKRVK